MGTFHHHQGNYDKAVEYLERAATLAGKIGDPKYEQWAWLWVGFGYERLGQQSKGIEAYEKALEIARKRDDAKAQVQIACRLSRLNIRQGNYIKAAEHFVNAMEPAGKISNQDIVMKVRDILGTIRRKWERTSPEKSDLE